MSIIKNAVLILSVATLAVGSSSLDFGATQQPAGQELAARYHLRTRTDRFFDRATQSGREAQKTPFQSVPKPSQATPARMNSATA